MDNARQVHQEHNRVDRSSCIKQTSMKVFAILFLLKLKRIFIGFLENNTVLLDLKLDI